MTEAVAAFPFSRPGSMHKLGEQCFVPADPARGRLYPQTERACVCGVVRITVHGRAGAAWREWRLPGSPDQYSNAMGTPPCSLSGGQP